MKTSTPLNKLLSATSGDLSRTLKRARQLQLADQALQQLVGTTLAGHCHVANVRGTVLVLQLDSAAWAARLRYQMPAIQRELKASRTFSAILSIEVNIRPRGSAGGHASPAHARNQTRRPISLSDTAATHIAAVASATGDPALQAALRRLASRRADK